MNNEEKIMQMLERMEKRQDKTDAMLERMEKRQDKTDAILEQLVNGQKELNERVTKIDERVTKIEITQENVIIPQLQLLAEGHTTIQNQIKRLSVIDSMQEDITILKGAVKFLSQEVENLKNAM